MPGGSTGTNPGAPAGTGPGGAWTIGLRVGGSADGNVRAGTGTGASITGQALPTKEGRHRLEDWGKYSRFGGPRLRRLIGGGRPWWLIEDVLGS